MHAQIIEFFGLAAAGAVGGAIYWAVRNQSGVFALAWKSIRRK